VGARIAAAIFSAALAPMPARAVDEIQVYNAEIAEVGQWTVQQHLNYTWSGHTEPDFPGGFPSNHSLQGVAEIEAESRERRRSKSDVVRERLSMGGRASSKTARPPIIADIVGAVDGLPADLSSRKKAYLKKGYGRNRTR
jgi:hypothetical protein